MLKILNAFLAIALLATPLPSLSAETDSTDPELVKTQIEWTPLLMRTTVTPQIFQGSDGKYNLLYELLLNNLNKAAATITDLQVIDADTGKPVKELSGKKSLGEVISQPSGVPGTRLAAGATAIVWVNLSFDKQEYVPQHLTHQVTFDTKSMFDGSSETLCYKGASVDVIQKQPLVISPPLRGGKWIAVGGYNGAVGHRRTLFGVNNTCTSAQRYAIDWIRMDDANYTTRGERYDPASSSAYNQPIYAVSDGTIISAVDKFSDQVPLKPAGTDRWSHPAGNCIVEDLGGGLYGMYAHLKPGTLKVKAGDTVKRGDILGYVGNTGNSTGPHLHFHVADSPRILGSSGVPYVFDNFTLVGEVPDLQQFLKNDDLARPQSIGDTPNKGPHQQQLPGEGHIVEFQ
jgi:murein DD-endopeptidase MepM/ murein hydrolase activator NlpD